MRYTRYNYNKRRGRRNKKGLGFLASFTIVSVVAVLIGLIIGNIALKDGVLPINKPSDEIISNDGNSEEGDKQTVAPVEGKKEFYFLQCGVFSKKESSEGIIQTLPNGQLGFTIQEGDKFKAMVGVFTVDNVDAKSKELSDSNISNMKVKFELDAKSDNEKIKMEIIDGYVKILSQLNDKKVQGVKTDEFKAWIVENESKIKGEDEELTSLIESVKSLPELIDKNVAIEINKKIYDIVKKYRV